MIWQFIDSSSVGGAERHVATLADGLIRRGYTAGIVLLANHGENPWLTQLEQAKLPFSHAGGSLSSLVRALRAGKPGLIHTHGYKASILGRIAARIAGLPVVSTFHSGERGAFPVGAYEWLDDWTSILGQRIAVSQAIQTRLPFPSSVIPSYVLTSDTPPTLPLPPVAAFVGRLSAEKGPDVFCQLASRAPQGTEWHVWGDGIMRAELEGAYGARVTFHGVATDMDQVWPRVGLLVMPSRFEGVPLAALEAAARGIPVLASRVGGLPTVVVDQQTGWLFPAEDVTSALVGLAAWSQARTTQTEALRHACWAKAHADFSEERWLPRVLDVYKAAGWRPKV